MRGRRTVQSGWRAYQFLSHVVVTAYKAGYQLNPAAYSIFTETGLGLLNNNDNLFIFAARRTRTAARAALSGIPPHFRPGRHRLTAPEWRTEMADRFAVWREVTATVVA